MIDDHNMIAHEYKDHVMNVIWPRLLDYLGFLQKIAIC